jgi:molybdopterin-binding protein
MRTAGLFSPREAARMLGVSYPTIKQWIYKGRLHSRKTPGGHYRIPAEELDRLMPVKPEKKAARQRFQRVSGRNQLVGRILEIKIEGLLAQVKLAIGGQQITSVITSDAAREMGLKRGQTAAALMKATEVMIVRV